jgi:hypothetical protein
MPFTDKMKQTIDKNANERRSPLATSSRARARKAPGTRLGIIQDWREAQPGKAPIRFGCAVRDGR